MPFQNNNLFMLNAIMEKATDCDLTWLHNIWELSTGTLAV